MKIAICDDEIRFVENVKKHIAFYSNEKGVDIEVYAFCAPNDLLKTNEIYNIAILDVEMPDMNGLELGEKLREKNRHIILMYITAHTKYLDDALNLNATRFFEKPIDSKRFYLGLDDAIKRIDETIIDIYLRNEDSVINIAAEDIVYVEISNRKTKVVTENKIYESAYNIKFWERKLISSIFVKPHKSYIINLKYLTKYERSTIELNNQYKIGISRSYQTSFYKKFISYMEGK